MTQTTPRRRGRWSRRLLTAVTCSLGLGLATSSQGGPSSVPEEIEYMLTAIEGLPSADQLRQMWPANPEQALLTIAAMDNPENRLVPVRAVSALGQLPSLSSETRTILKIRLADLATRQLDGAEVFLVMATLETLAKHGQASDVVTVSRLLNHVSRDVRVTAARALRSIGDSSALDALRARQNSESILSVKLAISEAIQALGQIP